MSQESFILIANRYQAGRTWLREQGINPNLPEIQVTISDRTLQGRQGAVHVVQCMGLPGYVFEEVMHQVKQGRYRWWTSDDFAYLRGLTALGLPRG